jgi:hypothetical protein
VAHAADVRLQAVLPEMTIDLDFDYNPERDRTHEADIWLTYEQPTQADLIASKLATIHFAVYASQSYIQRHGIPSTMDSLKNHRVVEHISPGMRSELLNFLSVRNVPKASSRCEPTRRYLSFGRSLGGVSVPYRRLSAKSQVLRLPYL